MRPELIDITLILLIAGIVGYYIYLRYREEKRKKEKQLIPTLEYYRDRYLKERSQYIQRAEKFRQKMEHFRDRINHIKNNIQDYSWNQDEKKILKTLKGTDFEWTFSVMFEILGYRIYEPPVFKDHHIDFILEVDKDKKVCIDFVDHQQAKKLGKKYIDKLLEGKEKYRCSGVWIITNSRLKQEIKEYLLKKEVNLFEYEQIIRFFPSIRIVEDYYETTTRFHNYELLHKETTDEIIRRDTWLNEVEEKLQEAYKKLEEKKAVAK
ncbi:restriction endonuclease [Persephonella sp.]|nr:hypothetical protein [Aquificota bacterium]